MPPLEDVVILSGVRTPVGKFQGSLSDFSATQLGALVVREAVQRARLDPALVDECIMGNVVSAGLGQNPARQAALYGGLPAEVGALTIYELNEAFSVQAIAVTRELGLDPNKVNVNGGAVAIGHPIGASGARVLVTLIYEMIRRDVHKGIAALCLGGGNAVAMAVER